jgi:hypothetical protein
MLILWMTILAPQKGWGGPVNRGVQKLLQQHDQYNLKRYSELQTKHGILTEQRRTSSHLLEHQKAATAAVGAHAAAQARHNQAQAKLNALQTPHAASSHQPAGTAPGGSDASHRAQHAAQREADLAKAQLEAAEARAGAANARLVHEGHQHDLQFAQSSHDLHVAQPRLPHPAGSGHEDHHTVKLKKDLAQAEDQAARSKTEFEARERVATEKASAAKLMGLEHQAAADQAAHAEASHALKAAQDQLPGLSGNPKQAAQERVVAQAEARVAAALQATKQSSAALAEARPKPSVALATAPARNATLGTSRMENGTKITPVNDADGNEMASFHQKPDGSINIHAVGPDRQAVVFSGTKDEAGNHTFTLPNNGGTLTLNKDGSLVQEVKDSKTGETVTTPFKDIAEAQRGAQSGAQPGAMVDPNGGNNGMMMMMLLPQLLPLLQPAPAPQAPLQQ